MTPASWYPILENGGKDSKLIIADNGSTDKTHFLLKKLQKTHHKIEILEDTDKQHGPKLMALYKYASDHGADWIFQTDSDGQTDPDEFGAFWTDRNKYDCIIGNRIKRGDGLVRYMVEKAVCMLLWLYFGVNVPDANAPFRLMKTEVIAKYLDKLPGNYNIPNIMITAFLAYYHENIVFRQVSFKPRKTGTNSINIMRIINTGMRALVDFKNIRSKL